MQLAQYDYTRAVLLAIDDIAKGHTLTEACTRQSITAAQFRATVKANAELEALYSDALQACHDALAEALITIDRHVIYGQTDAKMAAVISKNIQWYLERVRRELYGQNSTLTVNVTADRAITEALERGRQRAIDRQAKLIEATAVDVTPADATPALDLAELELNPDEQAELARLLGFAD